MAALISVAGFLLRLHGEIDHGHGRRRHAEGHAGELALHFWNGETHGLGGTGAGRDDVDGGAAATLPILLARAVHGLLRGGVGVDGGHEAFGDAESFLEQHMDNRREAVRGAACVGNDVMLASVILLMIHAHDDGDVLIFARSGDDDLLRTCVDVTLRLAALGEQTGGFDDNIDAEFLPRQSGGPSRTARHLISCPSTTKMSSSSSSGLDFLEETFSRALPCVESYFTR
jgi:hypothetical protein